MPNADTYAALNEVFQNVFNDNNLVVGSDTTAADVPGWDSLSHISLVVATEMRFGIRFRTAELERLRNVADFATLIEAKRVGR